MSELPPTERRNPRSVGLDAMSAAEVIEVMDVEERHAIEAVRRARPALVTAAEAAARTFADGGTIAYVGAGTSGHLALLDAAEVSATFGVEPTRFRAFVATGSVTGRAIVASSEDDVDSPVQALDRAGVGRGDLVLGVAASGTTPFVLAAVEHARRRGCSTVGLANNPGARLLEVVDIPVLLDTGPEVLTGSTRLKAGTAQKLALNRISTTAMVLAGRVVSNLMVDVGRGPAKLRARSVRILQELTGLDETAARDLLDAHDWSIRHALGEAGAPGP